MRCAFTQAALDGALAAGTVAPVAVVLPRGPRPLGEGWPDPPFDRWLAECGIAVVEVDRLAGDGLDNVLDLIGREGIALGVGACFPWKAPAALRERLAGGVLNIHPAMLPALRGPEPVFHAYRTGLDETGVTVHLMDAGWDSGPVLARARAAVPETGRADAFETDLARRGGHLLASVARAWVSGAIVPVPQDDRVATWAPVAGDDDHVIPNGLTAARTARFLRACGPLLARAASGNLVAVTEVAPAHTGGGLREGRSAIRIACADGDLWVR
jgi:methionyl-tRNA formyltransferase